MMINAMSVAELPIQLDRAQKRNEKSRHIASVCRFFVWEFYPAAFFVPNNGTASTAFCSVSICKWV